MFKKVSSKNKKIRLRKETISNIGFLDSIRGGQQAVGCEAYGDLYCGKKGNYEDYCWATLEFLN